jgi:ribonuclease P protein component
MLSADHTLKKHKGFDKVLRDGKMHQRAFFGIAILERNDNDLSRFGVLVSSKVTKIAVQRNRIKRAITEAIRYQITNVVKGKDVVFLVKSITARKTTDEIMRSVKEALKSLKLVK